MCRANMQNDPWRRISRAQRPPSSSHPDSFLLHLGPRAPREETAVSEVDRKRKPTDRTKQLFYFTVHCRFLHKAAARVHRGETDDGRPEKDSSLLSGPNGWSNNGPCLKFSRQRLNTGTAAHSSSPPCFLPSLPPISISVPGISMETTPIDRHGAAWLASFSKSENSCFNFSRFVRIKRRFACNSLGCDPNRCLIAKTTFLIHDFSSKMTRKMAAGRSDHLLFGPL